ncbi:MAG: translation initiation factor IF-2 [Alicyclobacillus macrosporangiidus]|uniref:translation initiation factor IF-2 n=1 Tax=Alicyclobacillus macrosporangiidus TaxID=392015 RepID=UPI0026ED2E15|nr:translation initiation factor IF-2 [Alicyclobacillus macrosporangiidus]MCL6597328.1 translation initiation factor IF-2 [Alicyclobacillus macrosporangiidus]
MSSKEILTILNRLDVPVANHMSVMDDDMVKKVEQFFADVKQRAAQRHATEMERELREKQRARERAARLEQQRQEQQARAEAQYRNGGWRDGARKSGQDTATGTQAPARPGRPDADRSNGRAAAAGAGAAAEPAGRPSAPAGAAPGSAASVPADRGDRPVGGVAASRMDAGRVGDTRAQTGVRPGFERADRPGQDRNGRGSDRNGGDRGGRAHERSGANRGGHDRSAQDRAGYDRAGRPASAGGRSAVQGGSAGSDRGPRGGYDRDRGSGGRPAGRGPNGGAGGSGGDRGPRGGFGGPGGDRGRGGRSGSFVEGRDRGARGGFGGGFGGARGGGRPGGFGGGAGRGPAAVAQKPVSPASKAKEKERERGHKDFDRDRKERFNEEKLVQRSGGRRRAGSNGRADVPSQVTVEGPMTVGEFAKLLHREASEIIKKLLFLGVMATINQQIDTDAMELIADEYGVELVVKEPVDEEALDMLVEADNPEDLVPRPPVVTIMGHVDHGKTTLLDAIRKSRVVATEAGGITQHIGAYQVEVGGRKITFLDTPGHEAFTTMRARGAQVTDITILVVAADDGVMPQTVEAINHAKAANVPIIVAVNKIDKPEANPDRVKQELTQYGLVAEEWGGDTVFVNISALKKEGLDQLLEMVLLVADLQDLKANPKARPRGTVIEAKLDRGRGPVATVLVQNGTLRVGDIVVAGTTYGRVRAMTNDLGKRIKEAGPSTPVEIQGLGEVPSAGDLFVVYDDERAARQLVQKRANREKAEQMQTTARVTLDDLYRQIQEGNVKELNVIVKADVQGSVEAIVGSIEKIDVAGVRVKVIHRGVGAITESDVALANASNAIIIGFQVRPDANAARLAEEHKVDIRLYRVIYDVTAELESAMKGLLEPEFKEVVLGHAEVRQVFHISKVGTVAGCYVTDGKLARDAECRLVRNGVVVYEGKLDSLKRFKDDVREVASGFECGLTLERFNDIKVGDVVEAFKMEAVKPE